MLVGMSRRLRTMGGFSILAGVRITRRNAMWMIWIFFFLAMFWLMWKMLLLAGWGMYFMFYGIYLIYKYMFLGIVWVCKKAYHAITGKAQDGEAEAPPERAQ